MRKWLTTGLALVVVAGTLAGCGGAGKGTGSAQSAGSDSTQNGNNEKLDITMMTKSYEGGGWPEQHPMIDYIDKKFNVNLTMQWVPSDNYKEKMNVLAASNSFPDAFFVDKEDFLKWRDKGVFMDVKPQISNYPNLLKYLGGDEAFSFMNPKGKYFGLPYYSISNRNSLGIRKDWLAKLNLKMPETIDQFYEVAKAFAQKDPDGDGKPDTIGFSASLNPQKTDFQHIDQIKAAFGLYNGWGVQDGKLIPWQTQTKELKDFVAFMQKAYAEGVLDKDFAVNKAKDPQYKYEAGKVGFDDVVPTNFYQTTVPNLKKIDPNAETVQLLPPKGPDGHQGTTTAAGLSKIVINAHIDPKKQQRILEIFDYFMTDEGNKLIKDGIEGVDYKKDGDKYVKLDAFDKDRPYIVSMWLLRRFDPNITVRLWDDQQMTDNLNAWYKNNEKYNWPDASAPLDSPTQTKLGPSIDQKLMSAIVKIITGDASLDSLDQAIDQWKKSGGDKIIQEMNDDYKKLQ